MKKSLVVVLALCLSVLSATAQKQVHFNINEPCNVRLWNESGQYFRPDSLYFWRTFMKTPFPDFPSSGKFDVSLPPGNYKYELDRGPEYYLTKGEFHVDDKDLNLNLKLKRLIDMKKMNWWSGELHVHRKPKDIQFLMEASDLHIAPVITSWNENYPYTRTDTNYVFTTTKFDKDRYYTITGAEDERGGGALLVLNESYPINYNKQYQSEYPPLAASVMEASKLFGDSIWMDIDKPFWWDVPILLSTGKINSVGIATNHMDQEGVFDSEAWGKTRDKTKYPAPRGNGYWTQDVYYNILNSGIRMIPSAGSASGVLLNPLGYNREYVYVKNGLTYDKWFAALKEGKCFVTNGPMLFCKADHQLPGHIFSSDKEKTIDISGKILSRDTIESIEVIKNGKVYSHLSLSGDKFSSTVPFEKSGWFLVRVMCKVQGNFRFASTAPFYVEIGKDKRFISKASAQFFLDWLNERAAAVKAGNGDEMKEINKYIGDARKFWEDILSKANGE